MKSIILIIGIILIYTVSIFVFATPKIDNSIRTLEEQNAKEILDKKQHMI